jgi:NAD(P)-dependent dehydrogenase (short-subunit alcohol dehydrogenase family)
MVFHPGSDIPDLSGKVIIVTGGSSGLGKESVLQLAKHNPARIFLGARTAARGNAAIAEVEKATPSMKGKITFLEMDLASFPSLQKAAKTVCGRFGRFGWQLVPHRCPQRCPGAVVGQRSAEEVDLEWWFL